MLPAGSGRCLPGSHHLLFACQARPTSFSHPCCTPASPCHARTTCCTPASPSKNTRYYARAPTAASSRYAASQWCNYNHDGLAVIESPEENARAQTACGNVMCWLGLAETDTSRGEWAWIETDEVTETVITQHCTDQQTAVNSPAPCNWAPCNQNQHFECSTGNKCYAGNADARCTGKPNGYSGGSLPANTWCWNGNLEGIVRPDPISQSIEALPVQRWRRL